MLLAIILVIVYLPQQYLAALLPVQSLLDKPVEKNVEKTALITEHKAEKKSREGFNIY